MRPATLRSSQMKKTAEPATKVTSRSASTMANTKSTIGNLHAERACGPRQPAATASHPHQSTVQARGHRARDRQLLYGAGAAAASKYCGTWPSCSQALCLATRGDRRAAMGHYRKSPSALAQLSPLFAKGSWCRRGKIARFRPGGPWARQMPQPTLMGQGTQYQSSATQPQAIQPRTLQHGRCQMISQLLPAAFAPLMRLKLAQTNEHMRNIDFHRASGLASAAQRRCMRQMWIIDDAIIERRQNAADRPGVNAAISMAADATIHRAGVQTGAAADALQALAERRSQHTRAAVVEQYQVKLFRSIRLAAAARSRDKRGVHRQRLPRRRSRQQFQEYRQIPPARQYLLNAHQRHMNTRAGSRQPGIAFVGNQHDGSRLRNGEIDAADAHVGLGEFLPQ